MSKKLTLPFALGFFLIGISLYPLSDGLAQTSYSEYTWNNSTNNWTTSTAWSPNWSTQYTGTTNSSGQTNSDVAIFTAGTGNTDVLTTQNRTIWGIRFTTNASGNSTGYTISSSGGTARALDIMSGSTLLPGGLVNSSGTNQVFNLLVRNANGSGTWSNTLGSTTTFNGGLNLNTDGSSTTRTLTLAGAGNVNVTSTIGNGATNVGAANRVTITSTGTTTFSGNNTYDGVTTMNAAGGTLTLSGNNSGAAGGVTVTAGTLNVNSANALGSGALNLTANSILNNTSGGLVANAGNNTVVWGTSSSGGFTFGTAGSTSLNNLNLGTGTVIATSTRNMSFAGTGTTLTMGTLDSQTTSSSSVTFTINGAGNTLVLGGYKIRSLAPTSNDNRFDDLEGTANLTITGEIQNGNAYSNGFRVRGTGVTTFSGNNTYDGLTTMNAAGGTLTLSGDNSGAAGGVTLTAGTLNINNNNALGTGALSLAGTGATINNTSGSAVVNAGNQSWTWQDGLTFGASGNSASNNLDLGTGVVTLDGTKTMNLVGNGTKLTIGAVNITSTSSGRNLTFNGAGNTLEMRGLTLSANTTTNVTVLLAGSANINVTGAIVNGTSFANGVNITNTGITTFSGQNTYTGATEIKSGATLRYGTNNVTADNGGRILVDGTLNLESYSDEISAMRVTGGARVQGTGTLTANSVDSSGGYSFAFYGENQISANLAGSAATLFKSTAGSVSLLSGNNSYGGATTVTSGTIRMGSSTALGSTAGSTTVSSGGLLDLNGQTGVGERTIFTGTGALLNSAVGTTASVDGTMDLGSEMVVNTVGDITLNGQLTGLSTRVVTKTGSGVLKVTASNSTFSGTNKVSAGTLLVDTGASIASSRSVVDDGGLLKVNGTAGTVTVNIGGTLGGSGTVGALTVANGAFLTPGNSPGTLNATSASLLAGSTYNWEINSAAISASAGTNWDLLNVANELNLSTLSTSNKLNLVLKSLDSGGLVTNSLADFTIDDDYTWVFAQAGEINNAAFTNGADVTDYFNINTTAFNNNALDAGYFKVRVGETTVGSSTLMTLQLTTIPEPSTGSMLGLGFAGLVVTRLLRRKIS